MGKNKQPNVCSLGLTNYVKRTITLKRHNEYYMVLDVHGSIRNRTPFWTLVCSTNKQTLGEIDYSGHWKSRPRVADDIIKEAEELTRKHSKDIVDTFYYGIPDADQEY